MCKLKWSILSSSIWLFFQAPKYPKKDESSEEHSFLVHFEWVVNLRGSKTEKLCTQFHLPKLLLWDFESRKLSTNYSDSEKKNKYKKIGSHDHLGSCQ